MKQLEYQTLVDLKGGKDDLGELGCFLWGTELAVVVGVGFISGGLLGIFAIGLAMGALRSDFNPC